jgi:hypothetical protein
VSLTLESEERTGKVFLWESGAASLLFLDSATEHTWQDRAVLTSGEDLPRLLAPLVELVKAAADGDRGSGREATGAGGRVGPPASPADRHATG